MKKYRVIKVTSRISEDEYFRVEKYKCQNFIDNRSYRSSESIWSWTTLNEFATEELAREYIGKCLIEEKIWYDEKIVYEV